MAESTEKRELELVDKLDFRILDVANNESKLEALLSRFLAPLILKAGSEHAAVRNKTVAVLQRIVTFVQPPGYVLRASHLKAEICRSDGELCEVLCIEILC